MEVIVVDDGSIDSTPDVLRQFEGRIVAVRQKNGGLAAARNGGLRVATGEFVQFLDADDLIAPTKIDRQVALLRSNPAAAVCWSDGFLIDSAGRTTGPANINHPSGDVLHSLLTMWGTQVAAVLVRRSALDAVARNGSWFDSDPMIRGCEDLDLWLRLAARFRFVTLDEKLFYYRVGQASMSSNTVMMLKSGLEVLRRHADHHGDCAECRRAIVAGRLRWRTVAGYGLMQQAREAVKLGRWGEALRRVAAVAMHCPSHLLRTFQPRHLGSKVSTVAQGLWR
jgi:glycosyltransferase involved in cell wall biosynthesis